MIDSNENIRRPIPFGDTTQEDAEMAASVLGAAAVQQSLGDAPTVQRNPVGTYDRFYTPIGNIAVKLGKFYAEGQEVARAKSLAEIRGAMTRLLTAVENEDNKKTSRYHAAVLKYKTWLEDPLNRKPPSQIFTKGNKKLPFWAFSTLAGVTCPEAGACLKKPENEGGGRGWCYSFSAWRNIWPYFRALQNTILIRMPDKSHILNDMRKKLKDDQVVRLYVDGDMDSVETIDFWMETCRKFPKNHFYGYSKSWQRFMDWGAQNNNNWPLNYALNLSSGSKYEANQSLLTLMTEQMMSLINPKTGQPLVRGKFIAVAATKYPKKSKVTKETVADYKRGVQAAAIAQYGAARTFVCPNYCGACLPNGGHACGSRKFQDVNVAIGIH